jgi:hypothetical protein
MVRRSIAALFACAAALAPAGASARIEIFLMGQTTGLKPPPFDPGIRFRGTPFGHMALYIESAARDGERGIRQCREGERGGLVLTVDKELKDRFFIANTREEFLYGPFDPARPPAALSRGEIGEALETFNAKYGHLYRRGPGVSGLGQDYGTLLIRRVRGLVYPTTREEEAAIIAFWRERYRDAFVPTRNNCVTTIIGSLNRAGLHRRSFFIRGLSPYNAWTYLVKRLLWPGPGAVAPNGNFLRRDGSCLTEYPQIPSGAVYRSGRPFNLYSLQNLEYTAWAGPAGSPPLPSDGPVSFRDYPTGRKRARGAGARGDALSCLRWAASQPEEFVRLWIQSIRGLLWLLDRG